MQYFYIIGLRTVCNYHFFIIWKDLKSEWVGKKQFWIEKILKLLYFL